MHASTDGRDRTELDRTMRWPARRVALFLVPLFFLYAYPLGFSPGSVGANQSAHGFLALALYEDGVTKLDGPIQDYFFNHDLVYRDGSFYSNKPPGLGFLLVPFAALLDALAAGRPELLPLIYFGRLFLLTLPFVLFLFWIGRSLEALVRPAVAWGLTLAYGLGTSAAAYASLYFSHQLAAMGLVAGFLLILRGGWWRLVLGGLACGFAVLCEYQVIVIAMILTGFAAMASPRARFDVRATALFVLGALPMAAALLYYNAHAFGSPAEVSYQAEFEHFDMAQGSLGFTAPSPTKFISLMFSPALGLFFYSPWLLFSLVAVVVAFRGRHERRRAFLAATLAGFALPVVISAHGYWVGGAIAGPRYLAAGIPFLLFPIAGALGAAKREHRRALTVALVATALVSVLLFTSLLLVGPFVNTKAEYLTQNPFASVVWPMLTQGLSAFTVASACGASTATSVTIHVVLVLGVLLGYGVMAVNAQRAMLPATLAGCLVGVLLFAVWTRLGAKETPVAEQHVAYAQQHRSIESIPRDDRGFAYIARPEAVDPVLVGVGVRDPHGGLRGVIENPPPVEKVAHHFTCLQSLVWHPAGHLLAADPTKNTIYTFKPDRPLEIFATRTGYHGRYVAAIPQPGANGMALAPDGWMAVAGGSRRAVYRVKGDAIELVAHTVDGKKLNSPQAVAYRSDGTLYFTDPPFGLPRMFDDPLRELPFSGIFSVQDGTVRLEANELNAPTGLAFSPDERTLYVGDWKDGVKSLWVFDVATNGRLRNGRRKFIMRPSDSTIASNGLVVDEQGNIYITGEDGVWILSRRGRARGFVRTNWPIWSLAWGGEDRRTLYMAAGTALLRMQTKVAGLGPKAAPKR